MRPVVVLFLMCRRLLRMIANGRHLHIMSLRRCLLRVSFSSYSYSRSTLLCVRSCVSVSRVCVCIRRVLVVARIV